MEPASINRRPARFDKPLPQNLEAEKAVLGAILLDNAALKPALEIVNAYDFFHPSDGDVSLNGRIFLAMQALATKKAPIDLWTVTEQMKLTDGVSVAYVQTIADGLPKATNVKTYADIVREKSLRRAMIHKGHELETRAWES